MASHKRSVNPDIVKGRGEVKYLAKRARIIKIILRIQFCASLPVNFSFPSPCLTSCHSRASLNCQHTCTFLMMMSKPQCQLEREVTFHGVVTGEQCFSRVETAEPFWKVWEHRPIQKPLTLDTESFLNTWLGLRFYCGSPSCCQGLSEGPEEERWPDRGRIWNTRKGRLQVIGSRM